MFVPLEGDQPALPRSISDGPRALLLIAEVTRPFLPAFRDPGNSKQPLDLVPITGIDAK
jgi:hypothetical protein